MNNNDLINYYKNYDEGGRLMRDRAHSIEFLTTMKYLEKTLPKNGEILDICSGMGTYSFALADMGYKVTACDLVPSYIEHIKNKDTKSVLRGVYNANVLNLDIFSDNSFDAVLCMGAMYHLPNSSDRRRAVSECVRILKQGGTFAASYINRHAQVLLGLAHEGVECLDACIDIVKTGQTCNTDLGQIFYRTTPDEILPELDRLKELYNIGTDGIGYAMKEVINGMNDEQFEKWLDYHLKSCENKYLLGYSLHCLYIGAKEAEHGGYYYG